MEWLRETKATITKTRIWNNFSMIASSLSSLYSLLRGLQISKRFQGKYDCEHSSKHCIWFAVNISFLTFPFKCVFTSRLMSKIVQSDSQREVSWLGHNIYTLAHRQWKWIKAPSIQHVSIIAKGRRE